MLGGSTGSTHNSNMELDTNDHLETGSTAAAASIRRSTRASKATTTLPSASSQPKSQPTKESANRRESAQPQRPRREQQYSAENEFEQDEESQSDAESESLSESEHESTGNRRNRSNKSGATSKNTVRKSKDQKAQSSESESQLFEIINNSPNALEMALRDWLDTYNASKEKGMVELVEMLVQACGAKVSVTESDVSSEEGLEELLERMQEQVDSDITENYPLLSGRGGAARKVGKQNKFRKTFTLFWKKWIHKVTPSLWDHKDNGSAVEFIISFLAPLSNSTFRAFRHTSTAVALTIMTSLSEVAKQVDQEWNTVQRQYQAEEKRGGRSNSRNDRSKLLQSRVDESHRRKMVLEETIDTIFNGIFVHRYRDTNETIRGDCIMELGNWVVTYPEVFLDNAYLRYLGWVLSDKSPLVRRSALSVLSTLYSEKEFSAGLRSFTERFKSRMIEMCLKEIDSSTRIAAVEVIEKVALLGMLDADELEKLLPLVVATDAGVRDYITRLVAKVLNEETEEIVDELSSSNGGGEVQREWVFLKQLVDVLDKVHELVRSRDNEYRAAPNLKLEAFKNSKIQEENQDDELDESFWAEDNGAEVRVVNDLVVSVEDFVGSDKPAEMVRLVVESLWEDNDALKEWEAIIDYLSQSFGEDSQSPYALTKDQEVYLFQILSASLYKSLGFGFDCPVSTCNAPSEDNATRLEISRGLVKVLPKMLQRHVDEHTHIDILRCLLEIVRVIDVSVWVELRMVKAYTSFFNLLVKIFQTQTDEGILKEAVTTFRILSGGNIGQPELPNQQGEVDGENSQNDVNSNDVPIYTSTKAKMINLSSNILAQVREAMESVNELREEETSTSDGFVDSWLALRHAVIRLKYLASILDISAEMKEGDESQDALWDLGCAVMETSLVGLRQLKQSGNDEIVDRDTSKENRFIVQTVQATLDILALSVMWNAAALQHSEEVTLESESSPTHAESAFEKATKLIGICEGMIEKGVVKPMNVDIDMNADRDSQSVHEATAINSFSFNVVIQLKAIQVLCDMLDLAAFKIAPAANHMDVAMNKSTQIRSIGVVEKVATLLADLATETAMSSDDVDVNRQTMDFASIDVIKHHVVATAAGLFKMALHGMVEAQAIAPLLSFYGIGDFFEQSIRDHKLLNVNVFGSGWDGIVKQVLVELIEVEPKYTFSAALRSRGKISDELVEKQIALQVRSTMGMIAESLKKSVDLYLTSRVPSIEPAIMFARQVSTNLKNWSGIIPQDQVLRQTVLRELLRGLQTLCHYMVRQCIEWHDAEIRLRRGSEVSNFRNYQPGIKWRKLASEINSGWKALSAIAGVSKQLIDACGGKLNEAEEDLGVECVLDIENDISQSFLNANVEPEEGDKDWEGFWSFMKALETGKGPTISSRRQRTSKAVAVPRSRESSPGPKSRRASARPTKTQHASETAPSARLTETRRPSARGMGKRTTYRESSSEDENEDRENIGLEASSESLRSKRRTAYQNSSSIEPDSETVSQRLKNSRTSKRKAIDEEASMHQDTMTPSSPVVNTRKRTRV